MAHVQLRLQILRHYKTRGLAPFRRAKPGATRACPTSLLGSLRTSLGHLMALPRWSRLISHAYAVTLLRRFNRRSLRRLDFLVTGSGSLVRTVQNECLPVVNPVHQFAGAQFDHFLCVMADVGQRLL